MYEQPGCGHELWFVSAGLPAPLKTNKKKGRLIPGIKLRACIFKGTQVGQNLSMQNWKKGNTCRGIYGNGPQSLEPL